MRPLSRSPKIKTPRGRLSCTRTLGRSREMCCVSNSCELASTVQKASSESRRVDQTSLPGITSAEKETLLPVRGPDRVPDAVVTCR